MTSSSGRCLPQNGSHHADIARGAMGDGRAIRGWYHLFNLFIYIVYSIYSYDFQCCESHSVTVRFRVVETFDVSDASDIFRYPMLSALWAHQQVSTGWAAKLAATDSNWNKKIEDDKKDAKSAVSALDIWSSEKRSNGVSILVAWISAFVVQFLCPWLESWLEFQETKKLWDFIPSYTFISVLFSHVSFFLVFFFQISSKQPVSLCWWRHISPRFGRGNSAGQRCPCLNPERQKHGNRNLREKSELREVFTVTALWVTERPARLWIVYAPVYVVWKSSLKVVHPPHHKSLQITLNRFK